MITVIDAPCGAGKTSWAIQEMNKGSNRNYIFVTPFLSEVDRIKEEVVSRKFYDPMNNNRKGSKLEGLKNLILNDKDICTTHALFKTLDEDCINLLKCHSYTLVLDECLNVLEEIPISKSDYENLIDKHVTINSDNRVIWTDKEYQGRYDDYKRYAETNSLYVYCESLFMWTFPVEVLKSFDDTYIMTYLFDGQIQKYYYDMFGLQYTKKSVCKDSLGYHLSSYCPYWYEDHDKLKKLINICEDVKLNNIDYSSNRKKQTDFSKSWWANSSKKSQKAQLMKNAYNYLKNQMKAKVDDTIWTVFKKENKNEKGAPYAKIRDYSSSYISCNSRATNEYSNTSNLVYLVNRYLSPVEIEFFKRSGIEVNQELWALSELIQWIWRSRIRKEEPINIYIPSARMRSLLKDYLEGKII